MTTVKTILSAVEEIAPQALCEQWDNSGLLVGDPDAPVKRVGVCLDITAAQIEQAKELSVDCIVSHHPVIFMPKEARFLSPDPAYLLARAGIAAIAAHTNLDSAAGGVNDALAASLGLQDVCAFTVDGVGADMLRGGTLPAPMSADELADMVAQRLCTCVRYTPLDKPISRVAVCGGGAGEFVRQVAALGYDAYLSGDVRHHEFLQARAAGICLLQGGHYETEYPVVLPLADALRRLLPSVELLILNESPPTFFSQEKKVGKEK
jgi:dinuclear metal center YbgI/SA1388 family protein